MTGNYWIYLSAIDSLGNWCDSTGQVIAVGGTSPTCDATFSGSVNASTFTGLALNANSPGFSYTWDMGDGTVASGPTVSYTYPVDSAYLVCLTVSDSTCTDTQCDTIVINTGGSGNCAAAFNITNVNGLTVDLAATTSPNYYYAWDFGDGNSASLSQANATISHTYSAAGTYNVELEIFDSIANCWDATTMTVTALAESSRGAALAGLSVALQFIKGIVYPAGNFIVFWEQ